MQEEFELTPELLLKAYCLGMFPMAESKDADELLWFSPEQRGIIPINKFHAPRSLRKRIYQHKYEITFDKCFKDVIKNCASAREDTWINDEIIEIYSELNKMGYAHSVEAWSGDKLAGGLYGVSIGGAFFGESMFSFMTDASKVSLVYLVARLYKAGFSLLDAQFVNDHLMQFGIYEIERNEYLEKLNDAINNDIDFYTNYSNGNKDNQSSLLASSEVVSSPLSSAGASDCVSGTCFSSGLVSDVKSASDAEVLSFLQAITHTS